ncbi:MAG: hypothetical protein ACRDVG_15400 [Jatrophihabitantaceae bacterium]
MADITIHWAGLAKVAEVSVAFGVGIVAVFALGTLGVSRVATARSSDASTATRIGGYLVAGIAFTVCAAAAGYGLYLLIPQFHR